MFKRLRQLKISLAAKCQMLFGAAVLLIISAALLVPWQRMEQLVDQMNERMAGAEARRAVADHVAQMVARGDKPVPPRIEPATPTTSPTSGISGQQVLVRMMLLSRPYADLTRFEERAREHFRQEPGADPLLKTQRHEDRPDSFRYARAVYAEKGCMRCHASELPRDVARAVESGRAKRAVLGVVSIDIPYQVDANQIFLNRIFIFLAGLLAGTLAIVVFYLITTRLILEPVRVLQETADKVSKGNLNIRSDINTGDEFQQLAETFNKMLSNLQESEDQLRAINKSLDLKLGQMAESNLALYESNRLKSEFLANVSHELRTPLNSILGFAELLKDAVPSSDKPSRYIQNIVNSGKHLLTLITDLLDLAKIEAGRMEVRREPLSLGDLFEGLANIIKPLAEKKETTIITLLGQDVPIIHTDPAKLQQVLYNFLSNAIKFSPPAGQIELRAERVEEESVRISVADQGPGIPPDKHEVIFEKFRQLDGSVTREHGGTGLGLAISRELVQLLGGTIGVQSRPGEGATFWITLPIKSKEPVAASAG